MFVNAIYLYDDKLVIFFNSGDKPVTIDDELLDKTEEGDGFVFGSPCSTNPTSLDLQGVQDFSLLPQPFHGFRVALWAS